MGTIHNQTERDFMMNEVEDVLSYMRDFGISDTEPNRLRICEILEYQRRTNILVNNGDRWDEQISGIAKALESIGEDIRESAGNG